MGADPPDDCPSRGRLHFSLQFPCYLPHTTPSQRQDRGPRVIQKLLARQGTTEQDREPRWQTLYSEFQASHRRGVNVALHLLTTPLGLLGVLAAVYRYSPFAAAAVSIGYVLVLFAVTPAGVALRSSGCVALLYFLAAALDLGWIPGLALAAIAYGLQEAAHHIADEPTLQSTYMGSRWWPVRLLEHTLLLLPLVIESALDHEEMPLSLLAPRVRVYASVLDSDGDLLDLRRIADFVQAEDPPLDHTTHWWQDELPADVRESFQRLADSASIRDRFQKSLGDQMAVEVLPGMNELYVTGPPREHSSDTVFYTPHVDGPFAVYPFASVFRCMLAASPNTRVFTHFPMNQEDGRPGYCLTTGQALAFDFNREPHYITSARGLDSSERRINLKLHYLVYPRGLPRYGRALGRWTSWYDQRARALFLATILPSNKLARLKANVVLWITNAFSSLERWVGLNNLAYVAAVGLLSLCLGSYRLFLLGTSFVHYLIYFAVLRHPRDISFGRMLRNAMFYKTVATAQLAGMYLYFGDFGFVSLGLIAGGYGLAALALRRLGVVRTYFGAELGLREPHRIEGFPYGTIPHPMILGSILGLIGFHLSTPLREYVPWLVPAHILLYLAYLVEETWRTPSMLSGGGPPRVEETAGSHG